MTPLPHCPECSAVWTQEVTCEDHFHHLLFWEMEHPELGIVHHLMVVCFHLQHPSRYSMEGLQGAQQLLIAFVEQQIAPTMLRQSLRDNIASDQRVYPITSRPDNVGAYAHTVRWTMTVAAVVASGQSNYIASVKAWASTVLQDLRLSGNV